MNVVICAGGLNLRYKELSCFPKILLPSKDGTPILIKQLEYFKDANSVSVVINEKFADILKSYVALNSLNIKVIVSDNTDGSGNTLASVYKELPKKNVLFFWSDILFEDDKFELEVGDVKEDAIIFTVPSKKYRYMVENNTISNRSVNYDGNVPGIFWIKNISEVIPSRPVEGSVKDLIDLIQEKVESGMITISGRDLSTDITEYKSLEEYKKIISESTREDMVFPSDMKLTYDEVELMKVIADTDKKKDQLTYQTDWLATIYYSIVLRKYYSPSMYVNKLKDCDDWMCSMRDIEGYTYTSNCDLSSFVKDLSRYTMEVPLSTSIRFLNSEYVEKALEGYWAVRNLLENPHGIDFMEDLIHCSFDLLVDNIKVNTQWTFTHGNINSHNILKNSIGDIKPINPVMRYRNSMYCHPIVDKSEAYMVKIGLDDALRKEMIYKKDELPPLEDDIDATIKIAVYAHLLGMLPIFSKDIMKVNVVAEYAIAGLVEVVKQKYL